MPGGLARKYVAGGAV